jgi:Ca-activated chloride channel family protein
MQIHVCRVGLAIFAIAFFNNSGFAQGNENRTLSPYFYVQGDPAIDNLPLKRTRVDIAVSGVIADVAVVQTYRNEGSRPINARYIFPASTRAAVYSMRMQIGNQVVVAKIKEREEAQQEFEGAKSAGKSASLLEQESPNVFSMSLANVMPGDQIDIELRYTELLVPTDSTYEVVFPTVVGPRYSSQFQTGTTKSERRIKSPYTTQGTSPTSALQISARIAAGVPIQDLSSPSHIIFPQWQSPNVARLTLDNSDPLQGDRDFLLQYRLSGDQISSGLILYESQDENFFLYMSQPPKRITDAELVPREYIFVIDVSGSMDGFPLNTAKELVRNLIGQLQPSEKFNVILFAGGSTALAEKSLQADQQNISKAIQLLEQQSAGGGTELLAAVQRAMRLPAEKGMSRSIVLVTDGYITGERGVFHYIRDHLNQCNVFSFGIGSSVNRYLVEGVAKAGGGEPFIVTREGEAPEVAAKFLEYIKSPVLTDIQIKAVGFDIYDVQPAQVADLFAHRPVVFHGKWRGHLGGSFEISGKTGQGDYSSRLDVAEFQPDEGNRALRYLWARSQLAQLSDYGSDSIDTEQIAAITALGLKYNLLTQFTSFVAVLETIRNTDGTANEVDQPLPLPLGVSNLAVGSGTQLGSEPELIWLISACILMATFIALRRRLLRVRS